MSCGICRIVPYSSQAYLTGPELAWKWVSPMGLVVKITFIYCIWLGTGEGMIRVNILLVQGERGVSLLLARLSRIEIIRATETMTNERRMKTIPRTVYLITYKMFLFLLVFFPKIYFCILLMCKMHFFRSYSIIERLSACPCYYFPDKHTSLYIIKLYYINALNSQFPH